ncbi:MAG TPA: hypothetical protein VII59_10210, partial [Streptosporangiaceae bacterium]
PPTPAASLRQRPSAPAMQPPAGLQKRPAARLPRRSPQAGPAPRGSRAGAGGPALPPLPRNYSPAAGGAATRAAAAGGVGRARIREAPQFGAAPVETATRGQDGASQPPAVAPRQPWYQVVGEPAGAARGGLAAEKAQAKAGTAAQARQRAAALLGPSATRARLARDPAKAPLPYAAPHPRGLPAAVDGRQNCGPLEAILWRQWDAATTAPPPQAIAAVERLADFPLALQEKLANGLDGIYVGAGGVPDLDDMGGLHGVQLPSGKATWDACAGAYGDRKIVVGTRPSPTPDVMCHEVGHALDDLDSPPGKWQSDSPEFRRIYDQCQPYIASDFHRQGGGLGRKEFFADSFAAIASAQRPALVDMLGGNTRLALQVMLYFNRRYGI